jgi:hypothetical protein
MRPNILPITLEGFVERFAELTLHRNDVPFCFVLGAGASRSSGIRTGAEFVDLWLESLNREENRGDESLEEWVQSQVLSPLGLRWEERARAYPEIFERRYSGLPEDASAFFENEMSGKEPGLGYAVLAYILTYTANNIVVTTNFDNLVAEAVQVYTHTSALVVGHEALAGFARRRLGRPVICKVHRDLLLSPFNARPSVSDLPVAWRDSLTNIFSQYTPVVVGYGGNDGSLITFLEQLIQPPVGGIYWCLRDESEPDNRIVNLVHKLHGRFVSIEGFDELMLRMKAALGIPDLLAAMELHHTARANNYKRRFEEITAAIRSYNSPNGRPKNSGLSQAADVAVEEAAKSGSWWGVYCKAKAEPHKYNRQRIYEEGVVAFPESHFLLGSYANFLTDVLRSHDEAEARYLQALRINPNCEYTNGNYAIFLESIRKDYVNAERHYRFATERNPNSGRSAYNFGLFLEQHQGNPLEVAKLYQVARDNEPDNQEIRRVTERFFRKMTGAITRAQ